MTPQELFGVGLRLLGGIGLTFADSITKLLYGVENEPKEDAVDDSDER